LLPRPSAGLFVTYLRARWYVGRRQGQNSGDFVFFCPAQARDSFPLPRATRGHALSGREESGSCRSSNFLLAFDVIEANSPSPGLIPYIRSSHLLPDSDFFQADAVRRPSLTNARYVSSFFSCKVRVFPAESPTGGSLHRVVTPSISPSISLVPVSCAPAA